VKTRLLKTLQSGKTPVVAILPPKQLSCYKIYLNSISE